MRQPIDALIETGPAAPPQIVGIPVRDDPRDEARGQAAESIDAMFAARAASARFLTSAPRCAARAEHGERAARLGWNGKDRWLALSCEGSREVPAAGFWSPANRWLAEQQPSGTAMVLPSIAMKTATGELLMGWLASETDMQVKDWVMLT